MQRILFIESGVYEGGSFMSMVKHIAALNLNKVTPVIVFFNHNKWTYFFEQKGIKVYVVNDVVFTKGNNNLYAYLNALFMKGLLTFKVIPFLNWLHSYSISEIENIIVQNNIKYVHLNTELFRDRVGLIAAVNQGVPIVSHLRSKYELGKIHFSEQFVRYANKNVSKYVAVSQDTATFWIQQVKIEEQKLHVLYDYFEPVLFTKKTPSSFADYGGLKIVCVANLVPVKNHHFLLQACAPLFKEFSVKLFLLGKGQDNYVNSLKVFINELRINENVEFVGFTDNVNGYLENADAVLLFSKREGLPNVIIEALGLGAVVVATSVGGMPEIIEDGINGFLVPNDDLLNATQIIKNVLNLKSETRIKVSENAKSSVTGRFSKSAYCDSISNLYE